MCVCLCVCFVMWSKGFCEMIVVLAIMYARGAGMRHYVPACWARFDGSDRPQSWGGGVH